MDVVVSQPRSTPPSPQLDVAGTPSEGLPRRFRDTSDGPADLRLEWLSGIDAVGVTAGASAPELLVQQVVEQLRKWGGGPAVEVVGREENVVFALPKELRRSA